MIAVIDYKAGNLASVVKSLRAVGADPVVTEDPAIVARASRIVLPGVGHFSVTRRLADSGMTSAIARRLDDGVPFLGICLGMQWLFEGSEEDPVTPGLGAFPGSCERFAAMGLKIPHVGWNTIVPDAGSRLLAGIDDQAFVYFTHAYYAPLGYDTAAVTKYGKLFTAAVECGNRMGVQFHPEKSGPVGLKILENFVRLAC